MSNLIQTNVFFIFTILTNFALLTEEKYNIQKLEEFSMTKYSWNIKEKYIYYLDIDNYNLEDENVIQILRNDYYYVNNLTISEIDESIIYDNNSDINIIETIPKVFHIKYKLKPKRYYYEILIKKRKENQKYFVLLIEPNITKNNTEFELSVSCKIPQINLQKHDIAEGKYFSQEYEMDNQIEKFIKFNISNISLENHNLILFVFDQGVSSFYINNLTSYDKRTPLFIFEKNLTKDKNHIIYLSLLGQANKTTFQIKLDDHDISYIYSSNRKITSFYVERINCTKDFYIIESYFDVQEKISNDILYLDVNPIYGDYDIFYFDNFIGNISDIFSYDSNNMEKIEGIKQIKAELTGLKLVCKNPSLFSIRYLPQNINLNISEGKEITCNMEFNEFNNNFIYLDDISKEYKFYFGFYKMNVNDTYQTNIFLNPKSNQPEILFLTTIKNETEIYKKLYYEKGKGNIDYSIQTHRKNINFKIFLISNQYYLNIVEGLTKINLVNKAIAFKVRKDIIFDYFIFKAYSHNKSHQIPIHYELKIVEKKFIEKDKVMQGINAFRNYYQREIYMRFSNPYNKFNSRVKEDDYVYLLVEFHIKDEVYPIYVDIRYYYNDKIVSIEETKPKILLDQKEYKIYGNKNNEIVENILLNINKCNYLKNYSIETYYENNNNLVFTEKIINERTILFHKNLYNNSKIILYANNSNETNNDFISNNGFNNILSEKASYYSNGDIYMNYFSFQKDLNDLLQITKDYSITCEDNNNKEISFKWNSYILNPQKEFPVNYSIYILPQDSPINSICQMSLIPPNISLINNNNYNIELEKGKYKISIIASIVNKNFPLITFYDFLNFEVPNRINIKLIIIISISSLALIIGTVLLFFFCKRNKKKDLLENIRLSRQTRLLSMLGFDGNNENEGILFKNEDDEMNYNNNKNEEDENDIDDKDDKEDEKLLDKSDELKDVDEKNFNDFSMDLD